MPAACSLVGAPRPLISVHFQDVSDYISYFITFPSSKYKSSFSFIYDPLWLLELLWARQETQQLWIWHLALTEHTKPIIYSYITKLAYTQTCPADQTIFPQLANDASYSVITVQIRPATLRHHASSTIACTKELLKTHLIKLFSKKSHRSLLSQYIICVSDSALHNVSLFLQSIWLVLEWLCAGKNTAFILINCASWCSSKELTHSIYDFNTGFSSAQ